MNDELISSLRLALAKGCEFECPLQIVSMVYRVEGDSVRFATGLSQQKASVALAEEQLCDLASAMAWQSENDGELPCGIVKCIVPYSAIQSMGVGPVADWCGARLKEAATMHREPPNDIGSVPVIAETLTVSNDENAAVVAKPACRLIRKHPYLEQLHVEIAALLRDGTFPCAVVILMGRGPDGLVVDTSTLTFYLKHDFLQHANDVVIGLVETLKPQFFEDSGFYPGGAVACVLLDDVPEDDVMRFVGERLVALSSQVVPDASMCAITGGFLTREDHSPAEEQAQ